MTLPPTTCVSELCDLVEETLAEVDIFPVRMMVITVRFRNVAKRDLEKELRRHTISMEEIVPRLRTEEFTYKYVREGDGSSQNDQIERVFPLMASPVNVPPPPPYVYGTGMRPSFVPFFPSAHMMPNPYMPMHPGFMPPHFPSSQGYNFTPPPPPPMSSSSQQLQPCSTRDFIELVNIIMSNSMAPRPFEELYDEVREALATRQSRLNSTLDDEFVNVITRAVESGQIHGTVMNGLLYPSNSQLAISEVAAGDSTGDSQGSSACLQLVEAGKDRKVSLGDITSTINGGETEEKRVSVFDKLSNRSKLAKQKTGTENGGGRDSQESAAYSDEPRRSQDVADKKSVQSPSRAQLVSSPGSIDSEPRRSEETAALSEVVENLAENDRMGLEEGEQIWSREMFFEPRTQEEREIMRRAKSECLSLWADQDVDHLEDLLFILKLVWCRRGAMTLPELEEGAVDDVIAEESNQPYAQLEWSYYNLEPSSLVFMKLMQKYGTTTPLQVAPHISIRNTCFVQLPSGLPTEMYKFLLSLSKESCQASLAEIIDKLDSTTCDSLEEWRNSDLYRRRGCVMLQADHHQELFDFRPSLGIIALHPRCPYIVITDCPAASG